MAAPVLSVSLCSAASLLAGCTKTGFMSFVKSEPEPEASGAESLPPLTPEQLVDQLKGLDLRVGELDGVATSARPFMLCDQEQVQDDVVRLDGGRLVVRYSAAADACPSQWYKEAPGDVQHGTGLATYDYELGCPGAASDLASGLRAGVFFAYQTFHASGRAEAACLGAGGGQTRFKLSAVRSYGMDVIDRQDDTRRATMRFKSTVTAAQTDGSPCEARRDGVGTVTIADCTYATRTEQDDSFTFKDAERTRVQMTARLREAVAKPGERFYAGGTIELGVNGWHGTLQLGGNGGGAPVVSLTDGKESVRVRLNGAFTERLP
jgi:hypothetical protein